MASVIPYKLFREFRIPMGANEDFFNKAADYEPKKGDVFIVSYPKCGTTWVQHIVYLLMKKGQAADCISQVITSIPFLEQDGFPLDVSPLALKYHLPFQLMPYSERARYIYVARNPKDACVSYYHFLKKLPGYQIKSFDDFLAAFLDGQLGYGDFVDHVLGWFKVRHLPNVLFITYETLSHQRMETIRAIAQFLGIEEFVEETFLQAVLKYSSFEFMRSLAEGNVFYRQYLKHSTRLRVDAEEDKEEPQMMRKGIVGDWRNYFSSEQSRRTREYLESKPGGQDLLELWKNEMST